jgi:hypothetical protein
MVASHKGERVRLWAFVAYPESVADGGVMCLTTCIYSGLRARCMDKGLGRDWYAQKSRIGMCCCS